MEVPKSRPCTMLLSLTRCWLSKVATCRPGGTEQHRIGGQAQGFGAGRQLEMHFGIGAGEDFTPGVIHIEFNLQGAQCRVQGIRGSHDLGRKSAVRVLRKTQGGFESRLGGRGERFRHPYKNAQRMRIRNAKQLRPAALPGVDQRADVGIAGGNDAVKGATTRLKDSKSRSRATLAAAEAAAAVFAAASPAFSSASCLETDCVASSPCQRALVLLDRFSLARAVARSACAWVSC